MVETNSRSCQRICYCCCRRDEKSPKVTHRTNLKVASNDCSPKYKVEVAKCCRRDEKSPKVTHRTNLKVASNDCSPKYKVEVAKCCRPECVCPPKQGRLHKRSPQRADYIPLKHGSKEYYQSDIACHYKGEKYQNLINKLKMYLDKLDDRPCISDKPKPENQKPLIIYPGYIDKKHPSNSPPCNKMAHVSCRGRIRATATDTGLSHSKSRELVGGVIVKGCECIKRNGLQDQCPRTECGRKQKCVSTNPGPCCEPALAVLSSIEHSDEIRRQRKLLKWMEQNPKDAKNFKGESDKCQDTCSLESCYCCCCTC